MRRLVSGLLAAVDALALVALGLAVALVPATALWAIQFGFGADFAGFYRFSANVWLLGHGVDVTVLLDPVLSAQLGLGGLTNPIRLTIALLGIALLSVQLGVRAGRRIAIADAPLVALIAGVSTVAGLAALLTLTAASGTALPSRPQGVLLPTLIIGGAMVAGALREQHQRGEPGWLAAIASWLRWSRLDAVLRRDLVAALWAGAVVVAGVLAVAGVALAVSIATNYATVVGIYQSLQGGVLGGSVVTLLQLVVLPNLIVWTACWVLGAGFAVGTGTAVSPAGTVLGPIPQLPLLGAIPQQLGEWAYAVLLVPVLLAFIAAMVVRQRHDRYSSAARANVVFGLAAGIAIVAAGLFGLLAWWSGGAIGPGRMSDVGPNPLAVMAWSGALVFVGALVGGYAGRATASK